MRLAFKIITEDRIKTTDHACQSEVSPDERQLEFVVFSSSHA